MRSARSCAAAIRSILGRRILSPSNFKQKSDGLQEREGAVLFSDIFDEEPLNLVEWDDLRPVVEVGVVCARNHHEELVVGPPGGYGQLFVGVADEIE